MSTQDEALAHRAIAYLKQHLPAGDEPAIELSDDESPVLRPFCAGLLAAYVVDAQDRYALVQRRHLARAGLDEEALHRIGLANLLRLISERKTRVAKAGAVFAVLMGGDFEASVLLADALWERDFRQFVRGDYAVAVPARDVLAFCDSSSAVGLDELRQVIARVYPRGDHVLSDQLYVRRRGKWEILAPN